MAAERRHRYRPAAQRELIAAVIRYESEQRGLGEAFLKAIDRAIAVVLVAPERPALAPAVSPTRNVRRYVLRRFPYAVIYRLIDGGNEMEILAVAHHRRRPGYWARR